MNCSKQALEILTPKEKQLKELIMNAIIVTKADKGEAIRVLAWMMNKFKSGRVR